MKKKTNNFRLGGIPDILFLSVLISLFYTFLGAFVGFPLIHSKTSDVFITFLLGIVISFIGLVLLEIFWFERNLTWSGRRKK